MRTYKGFEIHRQTVSPRGWNVRGPATAAHPNGFIKTGLKSLAAAREFISWQIDSAESHAAWAAAGFAA